MMKSTIVFSILLGACCALPATLRVIDPFANWRIVGGKDASDGQFPYIISLRYKDYDSHTCGGSIIGYKTILTAAHCVDGADPSSLVVVAGSYLLSSGGARYEVCGINVHDGWDYWMLMNDVAVITLCSPLEMNDKVTTISLSSDVVPGGQDAMLCGWGTTVLGGPVPDNLQYLELKTVDQEECNSAHGGGVDKTSHICTLTEAGEGACHGDSGGPLTSGGKQIGIVSWGRPCAVGYPDVFTRVSSFVYWIQTHATEPIDIQ